MNNLRLHIESYLATNPTDEAMEKFYIQDILPHDKRSIREILEEYTKESVSVSTLSNDKEIKYNGWMNWETWNLMLWVNNDESLYHHTAEFAKERARDPKFKGLCREFFWDLFPTGTPDMNRSSEMGYVNWEEISSHLKDWNE
jgi:hypothetical protein